MTPAAQATSSGRASCCLPQLPRADGPSAERVLSSSLPMIVVAEPLTRPVAEPPYPTRRKVGELLTVVAVLAAVDLLYPLNRPRFWIPTALISVAAGAYAISGLRRFPGAARRWGFVYQRNREYGIIQGALWVLLSVLGAVGPVIAIRVAVATGYLTMPAFTRPEPYLAWCVVQDYVFFALALRNLLDFTNRHVAVWLTALMFGLSHYPFDAFMIATGTVSVCWGYVFATSRFIWLVTGSHFVLGLMVLA